jgi:hypothetical protein
MRPWAYCSVKKYTNATIDKIILFTAAFGDVMFLEVADKLHHSQIVIPPKKKSKPIQNPIIKTRLFQCLDNQSLKQSTNQACITQTGLEKTIQLLLWIFQLK